MKNHAFTLIELLVVVLIIGILSGIALPQYQKAVLKSHLVGAQTIVDSVRKNVIAYRLANDDSPNKDNFKYCCIEFSNIQWNGSPIDTLGRIGDYVFDYSGSIQTGTKKTSGIQVFYAPSSSFVYEGANLIGWEWEVNKDTGEENFYCLARSGNAGAKAKALCKSITGAASNNAWGALISTASGYNLGNYVSYKMQK